jgi:hypothetical protein
MKKIKNHPHFLFLLILLLMLSCNTKNSETTKVVSEVRPEISANDYKSGKWLEQLPEKKPLTFGQLETVVPKSLNGMPLIKVIDDSKKGRVALKAVYSNSKDPNKDAIHINFFITDGAGAEGYKHLKSTFNMLKFPLDIEEGAKISKISEWKGKRLAINQRLVKEKWVSKQEFISTQRYHLKLEGQNLKVAQLDESIAVVEQIRFPE